MDSGGGDAAARAERVEKEKKAAIAQINAMFGIEDPNLPGEPQANQFMRGGTPVRYVQDMAGTSARYMPGVGGVLDETGLAKAKDDWTKRFNVAGNKASREGFYTKIGQDLKDLNMKKAAEQKEIADRETEFQLARQGLDYGSADVDQKALLGRKFDEGLREASLGADQVVSKARTNDEAARMSAIDRIVNGMDATSAMGTATQSLETNRRNSAIDAALGTTGDIFENAGLIYQTDKALKRQKSMLPFYQRAASSGGYQGTVSGKES